MSRLGYICDGCGDKHRNREPAATIQDADLDWYDLCSPCYDDYIDADRNAEAVL